MLKWITMGSVLVLCVLMVAGCSSGPFAFVTSGKILAKDDHFIILHMGQATTRYLAKRYLGDEKRAWVIEDANDPRDLKPGGVVVIPLKNSNPIGVEFDGYQTVPILCYHRFGDRGGKLEITAQQLRKQLSYLKDNGYRVIPLKDLLGFLKGEQAIPKRSVVLTIDDGHRSIYKVAYPILKEFQYPATVFIYSDYMDYGGLTTQELQTMIKSNLISVHPHSKTHSNLTLKKPGESISVYRKRVNSEITIPMQEISQKLKFVPRFYAYPFGDTNEEVIELLKQNRIEMGLTVQPATNAAFVYPYFLRRNMIFGDRDMEAFVARLVTFRSWGRE
jgi:peptidoglycan/xylan/chitin deacetylase (PgdA/CDA1 family)